VRVETISVNEQSLMPLNK